MKKILMLIFVLAVLGGVYYWYTTMPKDSAGNLPAASESNGVTDTFTSNEPVDLPGETAPSPKPGTFSGKLEEVNKGCVGAGAKGECYVVVGGKRVTYVMNLPADLTGVIVGVPTFMDLSGKIGSDVEVYAQQKPDGTYTLYGSSKFYIKLK